MEQAGDNWEQAGDAADTDLGLLWPIKRSFIRYVARMGDGQILGGHGLRMLDASTFVFPPDADDEPGLLRFRGELRLQAHNGALALRIANPRVDFRDARAVLIVDHPEGSSAPVPMVTFDATATSGEAGKWAGTDVRLTVEAVSLFGGYYGEDEPFDDLTIVLPPR